MGRLDYPSRPCFCKTESTFSERDTHTAFRARAVFCTVSQVKSSHLHSVQFSSVQFNSNGVLRRPSLPDPSGASDREGTARRNWHGWKSGAGMVCLPQCRASSARGPPLTSSWRSGVLTRQGPSRRQWRLAQRRQGRSRALLSARHTLPTHYLTHACARATQASATCHGCNSEGVGAGR
jgi:hypothetical protein